MRPWRHLGPRMFSPPPLNQLATLFCKLASTFYALHSTQAPSKQTQTSLSACAHGFFFLSLILLKSPSGIFIYLFIYLCVAERRCLKIWDFLGWSELILVKWHLHKRSFHTIQFNHFYQKYDSLTKV